MRRILVATSYFPPAAYLSACLHADEITVEAFETYPRQTFRNHCRICGPNGVQTLTVPVTRPGGNHTMTRDIRISNGAPWQRTHWRAITAAYNKSPFLLYYQDHLTRFFNNRYDFLLDLNLDILHQFLEILKVDIPVVQTVTFEKSPARTTDLRSGLVSKHAADPGLARYIQPFSEKFGFKGNLSCLDLLFNLGPDAEGYLQSQPVPGINVR